MNELFAGLRSVTVTIVPHPCRILIPLMLIASNATAVLAAGGTSDNGGILGNNGGIIVNNCLNAKFSISPTIGQMDTPVTISNGECPFSPSDVVQVNFGSTSLPYQYTVQSNGRILVAAPSSGLNDATVPVTVTLSDGTVVGGGDTTFTYWMAEMDLTGPLPVNPSPLGEVDAQWVNGANHTFAFHVPIEPPNNVLMFGTTNPVLHVNVNFNNSGKKQYVPPANSGRTQIDPNEVIGDQGLFAATLQVCNLVATAAQAAAQNPQPASFYGGSNLEGGGNLSTGFNPIGRCANWDGSSGYWTNVGSTQQITLTINDQGSAQSVTGDLALSAAPAFNLPAYDYAHTFRIVLSLAETDSIVHDMANRTDDLYSLPFQIVLSPTAFVQLKALPFVIIYEPPGNLSSAQFSTTDAFNTNYSLSNSVEASNTSAQDVSGSTQYSASVALKASTDSGASAGAGGSATGSASETFSFDNTTEEGFGTLTGNSSMNQSTQQATASLTLYGNPATIPGSGQTCASVTNCSPQNYVNSSTWFQNQPFWNDAFQLLVHPQFVAYVIGSGKDRFVYWAADPVLATIQVWQLSACANKVSVANTAPPCQIPYSYRWLNNKNQYVAVDSLLTLTAQEAANLLQLDPFAAAGTQNPALDATRAVPFPGPQVSYGTKCEIPQGATACKAQSPQGYTATLTNTRVSGGGTNGKQTYTSTVTNMVGTSDSLGLSLAFIAGPVTETLGITSTNANQSTTTAQTQAIFSNSTATSTTLTSSDAVTLNDCDTTSPALSCVTSPHLPLPQLPGAQIYLDKTYGGLMFVDPNAPNPASFHLASAIAGLSASNWLILATTGEQSRQRFPDVPRSTVGQGAIGVLAVTGILPGANGGEFLPQSVLTRAALARALARCRNLKPPATLTKFSDIAATDDIASEVAAAVAAGVVVPKSATSFGPTDPVSREQMALALASAFALNAPSIPGPLPSDSANIAPASLKGVTAVINAGFMKLDPSKAFNPKTSVTRAEAAQELYAAILAALK